MLCKVYAKILSGENGDFTVECVFCFFVFLMWEAQYSHRDDASYMAVFSHK